MQASAKKRLLNIINMATSRKQGDFTYRFADQFI